MITITTHTDIKRLRLRPKTKYSVFRLNVLGDGDLTCGIFGIRLCAVSHKSKTKGPESRPSNGYLTHVPNSCGSTDNTILHTSLNLGRRLSIIKNGMILTEVYVNSGWAYVNDRSMDGWRMGEDELDGDEVVNAHLRLALVWNE